MDFFSISSWSIPGFPSAKKPALKQRNPTPPPRDALKRRLEEDAPISPTLKTRGWLIHSSKMDEMDELDGDTLLGNEEESRKSKSRSSREKSRSRKRQKINAEYCPSESEIESDVSEEISSPRKTGRLSIKSKSRAPNTRPRKSRESTGESSLTNPSDSDGDLDGETLLPPASKRSKFSPGQKLELDRQAMPPPPKPIKSPGTQPYRPDKALVDPNLLKDIVNRNSWSQGSFSLSEDELFTKSNRVRREDRSEINVLQEYERAYEHAEAQIVPEDSGYWSDAEKDLFYRLAMRGFEPLVPGHWSMDFKTLPHQLFARGAQKALITPFAHNEFRAKHFLGILFEIAARVRDKSLVNVRPELTIKRSVEQYIKWALMDAGVHPTQRPRVIPVHAVVTKRPNEDTAHLVERMEARLQHLAYRYQVAHRLADSVESSEDGDDHSSLSSQYEDEHMPTLIGIMIVSSVVAFVTLDSRSKPKSGENKENIHPDQPETSSSPVDPSTPVQNETDLDSDSDLDLDPDPDSVPSPSSSDHDSSSLRVIAKFDFSTHDGYDVWDGFAIAIGVMRIRKTMLELLALAEETGETGRGGLWERVERL